MACRIAHVGVRHIYEGGSNGRAYHVVELVVDFNRIRLPRVTQAQIQSKPAVDFPVVLKIRLDPNQALGAGRVRPAIRRSSKGEGIAGQKSGKAGENVKTIPVSVCVRIQL